ncbi:MULTISPECIES: xanthine dehydrogenase accessory protein XdhC [unclassified Janthinobacterium]|uniref:xanthine dehydrogenase accessory protein XdhC n=1 Tax=unclassified Janthinobacterium TaxID=2610881 RepID=UPI00161C6B0E|nr:MULTISPECIES: xanthine dehydrogenase accessory protein XdhC [unclassified Janthinobacterium]MBB5371039.1 xanthine dehydrogenase accessory factor [Janthinobacterium sp. K2C7]MBB5383845.1 xanthine dehydrogenase accessory factor [Janthinobacterium sp. K2Li3]MBB5388350.1 xanthine dehydrogenase accessory factor [Janthinobacterium sp. K2E3]
MSDWLTALANDEGTQASVLVTVALVEGSGPREAGAKMRVSLDGQVDTIGGGHLELRAVEIAKTMLMTGVNTARLERFALGPSLGQCCGGVVYLAFEPVDTSLAQVLEMLRERRQQDSWRVTALDGEAVPALFDAQANLLAGMPMQAPDTFSRERGTHVAQDGSGRRWLIDPCLAPRAHLTLFGAGHVGAAIVRALAELPCNITWVDEREDMFPAHLPDNVRIAATDIPEEFVAMAPPGGSFLVMTHSHALDQRLTEAIMAREDGGWFGLIGSHTKRKQFEHRLQTRGVPAERIAAMVCPIGMPGIRNKAPAVIAASVACQLLMVWEQAAETALATPLRLVSASPPARRKKRAVHQL